MSQPILYNCVNHVAWITLNSPKTGNVFNVENLTLLHSHLNTALADSGCRAIVIQGTQEVFCRGMDFNFLLNRKDIALKKEFSQPYVQVVSTIRDSPKPCIAAVDGEVLAGGMGIILACDIVCATQRSTFGLSEVLFGLIPAYVFPLLLERVPFKKARFLVLSSRKMSAEQAMRVGIVDETIANNRMRKALRSYLQRLLMSSPDALALTKIYSDRITGKSFDHAMDDAAVQLTQLLNKRENISAIRSFIDGDMPVWAVSYRPGKLHLLNEKTA